MGNTPAENGVDKGPLPIVRESFTGNCGLDVRITRRWSILPRSIAASDRSHIRAASPSISVS
jgi:hypothetical protein